MVAMLLCALQGRGYRGGRDEEYGGVVLVSYLIITVEETHVLLRAKRLEPT